MGMFSILPPAQKVVTPSEAAAQVRYFADKEIIAFDTETTGLSRTKDRAIILALSDGIERCAIWPAAIPYFADILEDPSKVLIAHNANYDCHMLKNIGINVYSKSIRKLYRIYDTMVMHALLSDISPHDLKSNAKNFLGIEMASFASVFDLKGRKKKNLEDILMDPKNSDIVCNYASLDAYATYKLFFVLKKYLSEMSIPEYPGIGSLWDYYVKTELPFTKVLYELETNGVTLNKEILTEIEPVMRNKMTEIQKWFGNVVT